MLVAVVVDVIVVVVVVVVVVDVIVVVVVVVVVALCNICNVSSMSLPLTKICHRKYSQFHIRWLLKPAFKHSLTCSVYTRGTLGKANTA